MPHALREPRQDRSRRTLERILAATEDLLRERTFEEITMQEIVRRAGTSVGAFYARFEGKEALLPALYDRYDATMPRSADAFTAPARSLGERVAQIVGKKLELFVERAGLLRAMAIHARVRPDAIPASAREARGALNAALVEKLLEFEDEIRHPDPPQAAALGLLMVSAMFRDKLLFGSAPHAASIGAIDPQRLGEEMIRALLCYLRGPAAGGP